MFSKDKMGKLVVLLLGIIAVLIASVAYLLGKQSQTPQPFLMRDVAPTVQTQAPTKVVEQQQKPVQTSSLKDSDGILFGIEVTSPGPYGLISSPVAISGRANVFEGHVGLRVKDANGIVLGEGFGTACMDDKPCPFVASVTFTTPSTTTGTVEAFTESAADGSLEDLISIPVTFGK